jgi:hypothetical protein
MTRVRGLSSVVVVLLASVLGIAGTGLLYTAIADQKVGALLWGLPLSLCGLYWCSRALARSHRSVRLRRAQRLATQPRSSERF